MTLRRSNGDKQAGFTLLEAVVALAVLTLALAMLYRGAAQGLAETGDAADVQQAVARAKSHLAVVGIGTPLRPGEDGGNDGSGFTWHQRVTEARTGSHRAEDPDDAANVTTTPIILYDVTVTIGWQRDGHSHAVTLASRRIGLPRPPPA